MEWSAFKAFCQQPPQMSRHLHLYTQTRGGGSTAGAALWPCSQLTHLELEPSLRLFLRSAFAVFYGLDSSLFLATGSPPPRLPSLPIPHTLKKCSPLLATRLMVRGVVATHARLYPDHQPHPHYHHWCQQATAVPSAQTRSRAAWTGAPAKPPTIRSGNDASQGNGKTKAKRRS